MGSLGHRRWLWVLLFLISGLPALLSAIVLPFNTALALPWVVLTWTVAVVSGYRIWRIDHPIEDGGRGAISSLGNQRGLWVFLFLVVGLLALFSAAVLPFNPRLALPWVVVTWTVAVVSGYRIWRIDHPYESAERKLARGFYLLLLSAAWLIALAFIEAEPMLLVIPLAAWLLLMTLLMLALWLGTRGTTEL